MSSKIDVTGNTMNVNVNFDQSFLEILKPRQMLSTPRTKFKLQKLIKKNPDLEDEIRPYLEKETLTLEDINRCSLILDVYPYELLFDFI